MSITDRLSARLGDAFEAEGLPRELGRVEFSQRPDLCQFQCNGAMPAAKAAKKPPREIAQKVVDRLTEADEFRDVEIAGPGFINLNASDSMLSGLVRELADDALVGAWRTDAPEKVIIDFGGPNIAKPLHVGHLRSSILGESLVRLLRETGETVVGDVHIGDWGLPMGMIITEIALTRPELPYFDAVFKGPYPEASPVTLEDLQEIYPKAAAAAKADPERLEAARAATAELQAGRAGYLALWKHFSAVTRDSVEQDFADLGVTFDLWKGEADAAPLIPEMAAELEAAGLVKESDGAKIIEIARDSDTKEIPPFIVFKSDGSVLYSTTDLATILDRKRSEAPDRLLYVVDQRQSLHFEQVFRAANAVGYMSEDAMEFIGFGTMNGPDGKPFKTRAGGVMKLRDLMAMVREKARARLVEAGFGEGYSEAEVEEISQKVGFAALKFADLSNPRQSNYIFDLDRFSSFEGKTGPYLLYAAVRVKSILRKAEGEAPAGEAISIASDAERALALRLLAYPDAIRSAHGKRAPHILCEHAYDLAGALSKFYSAHHILSEEDQALRRSRLALAATAGRQIERTLYLLGIETPERM